MKKALFLLQDTLENLLTRKQVSLESTYLVVRDSGLTYELTPAIKIVTCETSSDDPHGIVNKYISAKLLREAGAEIYLTSIIFKNQSYEIEHGYLCKRRPPPPKL